MKHGEQAHVQDRCDAQSLVLRAQRENCDQMPLWILAAVTRPKEKHGFRTETCNVFVMLWSYRRALMPPEWYHDVNRRWLTTKMQCLCLTSLQCPARIVLGLSQLVRVWTDSLISTSSLLSPSKHLHINFFIFQLVTWQYRKDLPPDS